MADDEDTAATTTTKSPNKPRIRPVSRITSSPLARLRAAKCFAEIDRRVRLGWSAPDLAHAVHDEFNELKDLSVKHVRTLIDRYRKSIPVAELSMMSSNSLVSRTATLKLANGLNELAELERLFSIQSDRIDMSVANEKKIGILLDKTGSEIFVAAKLLKQSTDLKMDLGLVKRQLGAVEVTGQMAAEIGERYKEDGVGKVIADPSARRKVISLAEKLMALTERAGIDAVQIIDVKSDEVVAESEDQPPASTEAPSEEAE